MATTNGRCTDTCFYCMGTRWRLKAYCEAARRTVTHSPIHTGPRDQPQAHTRNTSPTYRTTTVPRTTPETRSRADGSLGDIKLPPTAPPPEQLTCLFTVATPQADSVRPRLSFRCGVPDPLVLGNFVKIFASRMQLSYSLHIAGLGLK